MKIKRNNLITIGVFVVILFALFILYDKLPGSTETLTANGQASINVEPDLASVYVRIESFKDTAEAAKNDNSAKVNAVMIALKKIDMDAETTNYNIYPEYDWRNDERDITGYRATTNLKIKTEFFDDVGVIIDAVVNTGHATIDSINFELSDEREVEFKKQALAEASKDAREKAEAIASGMNVKLGKLVSVSSSDFNYRPYPLYESAVSSGNLKEAVSTVVEPQSLEVNANVNAVFSIR